jgi:hypothetical protein
MELHFQYYKIVVVSYIRRFFVHILWKSTLFTEGYF